MARSRDDGGCDFLVDPAHAMHPGQAIWRRDASPFISCIGPPLPDSRDHPRIDIGRLHDISSCVVDEDGTFLRIGQGAYVAHVWLHPACQEWGSIMLPVVPDPIRFETALWFVRWFHGQTRRPSPEGAWLTPFRRQHLIGLLHAYDDDLAGLSQQQLAARLLNPNALDLSAAAFAESAERKQIRRWLARACWLVDGGYRALLRGQWRFT